MQLLGDPVKTVFSLIKRLQKSLQKAVDQLNMFLVKLKAEQEETFDNDESKDPLAVLLKTNPHLSKFDPDSDTSKMDLDQLEWHKVSCLLCCCLSFTVSLY